MTLTHQALVTAIESGEIAAPSDESRWEEEWVAAVDCLKDFGAALVVSISSSGDWAWQVDVLQKRGERWEELASQGAYGDHWTHEIQQTGFGNVLVTATPVGDDGQELVSISGTAPSGTSRVAIQGTSRSATTYGPFGQFVILIQSPLPEVNLLARGPADEDLGSCTIEM
jgi:hypothetical protein